MLSVLTKALAQMHIVQSDLKRELMSHFAAYSGQEALRHALRQKMIRKVTNHCLNLVYFLLTASNKTNEPLFAMNSEALSNSVICSSQEALIVAVWEL